MGAYTAVKRFLAAIRPENGPKPYEARFETGPGRFCPLRGRPHRRSRHQPGRLVFSLVLGHSQFLFVRVEYPLTRMGQTLALPFFAMTEWADKWLGGGAHPLELRSKSTGQKLRVALVDERGRIVKGSDVDWCQSESGARSRQGS